LTFAGIGSCQTGGNALAERGDAGESLPGLEALLGHPAVMSVLLLGQLLSGGAALARQFLKADDLGLIGLEQPLVRVIEPIDASAQPVVHAITGCAVRLGDEALELSGRACIDNNPVERAIRPIAIDRRNWTFAGSDDGAVRAATMYSLIETAKLTGIDPEAWLRQVLVRIADHPGNRVAELLPWNVNGLPQRLDQRRAA